MATCKDCVHYEVCETHERVNRIKANLCGLFKNKAEFVEVKHGYWKWEKKIEPQAQNRLYCSVCDNECLSKNNYYVKSKHCPHCGAKMDVENTNFKW